MISSKVITSCIKLIKVIIGTINLEPDAPRVAGHAVDLHDPVGGHSLPMTFKEIIDVDSMIGGRGTVYQPV